MSSFNQILGRQRSAAAVILLSTVALVSSGCNKPLKVKGGNTHTVVLHVGKNECFAAPQVTHALPGDRIVFFVADQNASAIVSGLQSHPLPKDADLETTQKGTRSGMNGGTNGGGVGQVEPGNDSVRTGSSGGAVRAPSGVVEVDPPPHPPQGQPLSSADSLVVPTGHYGKVTISGKAKGIYELMVECGGKTDDPPKVVVW